MELFVAAMGAVGRERLERLGVVPLLVGSGRNDAAGTAYATKLREGLVEATGGVKDHLPCLHQLLLCSSIEFRPLTFCRNLTLFFLLLFPLDNEMFAILLLIGFLFLRSSPSGGPSLRTPRRWRRSSEGRASTSTRPRTRRTA